MLAEEDEEVTIYRRVKRKEYVEEQQQLEETEIDAKNSQVSSDSSNETQELFHGRPLDDNDLPTAVEALDNFINLFPVPKAMNQKEAKEVHREVEQLIRENAPKMEIKVLKKKNFDDILAKVSGKQTQVAKKLDESRRLKIDFEKEKLNAGNVFAKADDPDYVDLIIEPPEKISYKPPVMLGASRKKPSIVELNEKLKKQIIEDKARRLIRSRENNNAQEESLVEEDDTDSSSEDDLEEGIPSIPESDDEHVSQTINESVSSIKIDPANQRIEEKDKLLMFLSGNFEEERSVNDSEVQKSESSENEDIGEENSS